jgi:hypothetical protein
VSWKWYSGGWDAALASSPSNPNPVKPPPVDPNFQWHHQPLAFYDNFAPWLPDGERNPLAAAEFRDENNFFDVFSARTAKPLRVGFLLASGRALGDNHT